MNDIFDNMIVDDGRLISVDDVFNNVHKLKDYIVTLKDQRDRAWKELKEYNKDSEIQKLQEEIKKLNYILSGGIGFFITEDEQKKIDQWINDHTEYKHNGSHYAGAIGGRYSYKFTPTSIGDIGEIICSCGDKYCFREL